MLFAMTCALSVLELEIFLTFRRLELLSSATVSVGWCGWLVSSSNHRTTELLKLCINLNSVSKKHHQKRNLFYLNKHFLDTHAMLSN